MELGADWRQIAVEPAPVSAHYANVPLAARWAPNCGCRCCPASPEGPTACSPGALPSDEAFMVTADGTALAAL
jgi:isoquinoline 1-oxidoreductase beta subunit